MRNCDGPRCQIASDVGRAMRTTKVLYQVARISKLRPSFCTEADDFCASLFPPPRVFLAGPCPRQSSVLPLHPPFCKGGMGCQGCYKPQSPKKMKFSGARGLPQFLKKSSENAGANEDLSCGFPSIPGIALGVAPRNVAQVVRCHSENGISYSENGISNSESCSQNTPELSESSENGLFTPRAFFLKLGWSRLLIK